MTKDYRKRFQAALAVLTDIYVADVAAAAAAAAAELAAKQEKGKAIKRPAKKSKPRGFELYDDALLSLLTTLSGSLEATWRQKLFTQTLLECPRVSPAALDLVCTLCDVAAQPHDVQTGEPNSARGSEKPKALVHCLCIMGLVVFRCWIKQCIKCFFRGRTGYEAGCRLKLRLWKQWKELMENCLETRRSVYRLCALTVRASRCTPRSNHCPVHAAHVPFLVRNSEGSYLSCCSKFDFRNTPSTSRAWVLPLLGLVALKDLIFHKPATRAVCIPSVLRFTYHPDNDVRTKAVRLASNLLWKDPAFQPIIETFAKQVSRLRCIGRGSFADSRATAVCVKGRRIA